MSEDSLIGSAHDLIREIEQTNDFDEETMRSIRDRVNNLNIQLGDSAKESKDPKNLLLAMTGLLRSCFELLLRKTLKA